MRLSTRITLYLIELLCNVSTFMVFILGKLNNRLDSKEIANVWLMFEHHNNKKNIDVFFNSAIVMHLFPLLRQTDMKS